jgi:Transcription factor WhiB
MMTAAETLTNALTEMVDHNQRPPCAGHADQWTSDNRRQRANAARACQSCPLLTPCGQYADAIKARHGVWAGIDRTPRPRGHR